MRKVSLPECSKGEWKIIHKESKPYFNSAEIRLGRTVPAGEKITVLYRGKTLVMSDTPAEQADHKPAERHARGHCLINGLGIGMVLQACLDKSEVTKVTVVELSQDLIDLVSPFYSDPRVEFICANAFEYQPPAEVRYEMVWHDIWDTICADNLPDMHRLHRKYGRKTAWQGSWAREICENFSKRGY